MIYEIFDYFKKYYRNSQYQALKEVGRNRLRVEMLFYSDIYHLVEELHESVLVRKVLRCHYSNLYKYSIYRYPILYSQYVFDKLVC